MGQLINTTSSRSGPNWHLQLLQLLFRYIEAGGIPSILFHYIPLLFSTTISGVNKKPKKFKTVWHGFRGILKLSGRVNQASLKLSAGFSNTVCFCVANCLIWLKVKKIEAYLSAFCSINALSINKDNLLLPLRSTTPVFVCQMRKSLKLSARGDF